MSKHTVTYPSLVKALNAAINGEASLVQTIVELRTTEGFDVDKARADVGATLAKRHTAGDLSEGSAKVYMSRCCKLLTCGVDALVSAAAESHSLAGVYKAVLEAEPAKKSTAGRKAKADEPKADKPEAEQVFHERAREMLRIIVASVPTLPCDSTTQAKLKEALLEGIALLSTIKTAK